MVQKQTVSITLTCEEALIVESVLSAYAERHNDSAEDAAVSVVEKINQAVNAGVTNFKSTRGSDFEVGVNIMRQDFSRMGQNLGTNAYMLFSNHPNEKMKHITLINTDTGESVDVEFGS